MTQSLKCENCLAPLPLSQKPAAIIRCDYCGVEAVLVERVRKEARKQQRSFLVKLRREMDTQFDEAELKLLVFNLAEATGARLDYEDLSGNNQQMKLLELLKWCGRRNMVPQLVETAVSMRPTLAMLLL